MKSANEFVRLLVSTRSRGGGLPGLDRDAGVTNRTGMNTPGPVFSLQSMTARDVAVLSCSQQFDARKMNITCREPSAIVKLCLS
jgi:hypothetical protein